MTIEADVCVVGSGAGGGVVAGTLAGRGKQVCVLETGGYFNEADFNQLETWGYQNLYLRGGPFPTADGQVSIQAGSALGGGTLDQLAELPADDALGARAVGERVRARGRRRRRLRRATWTRSGSGSASTTPARDLNGPHQRMKEGCEALGWHFGLITRNADPASTRPTSPASWASATYRARSSRRMKTYLADANERGADFVVNCRAERILVEDGQAAGVEGTYTGPDGDRRPGRRPRSAGRRRVRLDRVAGAAAALGDRRAGGRRLPAAAPGERGLRDLRRAPGPVVGAAAGGALARVRRGRRRLRVPDRGRPPLARHQRRGDPLALGPPAQGGHVALPRHVAG